MKIYHNYLLCLFFAISVLALEVVAAIFWVVRKGEQEMLRKRRWGRR